MPGEIPNPVYLYRILDYRNLDFVLKHGINCPSSILKDPDYINIGNKDVIGKRGNTTISVVPGGDIHNYVSFYFGPKSPMLFSIKHKNSDYEGTQDDIIYLITSIDKVVENKLKFVFTDGHAMMSLTNHYNDLKHLDKIDWEIIKAKYWHDIPPDIVDRKRKRMAEFLIHKHVAVELIIGIGTVNNNVKKIAEDIVENNNLAIPVKVLENWYY